MVNIEKFYKRESGKALFFGYVNAIRLNLPGVSLEKAILNFQKHHNLNEDLMNLKTAVNTYMRMEKEYFETQKTKDS